MFAQSWFVRRMVTLDFVGGFKCCRSEGTPQNATGFCPTPLLPLMVSSSMYSAKHLYESTLLTIPRSSLVPTTQGHSTPPPVARRREFILHCSITLGLQSYNFGLFRPPLVTLNSTYWKSPRLSTHYWNILLILRGSWKCVIFTHELKLPILARKVLMPRFITPCTPMGVIRPQVGDVIDIGSIHPNKQTFQLYSFI